MKNLSKKFEQYPFGFERPEDSPGFSLWQTTILWQRKIKKALELYNIAHAQFVILATVFWFEIHNYDTTQIMISKWSKLDKMTVSKSLKKLATLELIKRMEHEVDTRAKNVSLTPKGKEMVKILVPIIENIDAEFFGKTSIEKQHKLLTILNELIANNDHELEK